MLVPNPGKVVTPNDYRYGFQGQEEDDELKGEGNSLNYTFRMHDPRIGRFFARDPLASKYPFYSPYQFSGNRVIDMVELEGLEPAPPPTAEGVRENAVDQKAVANNDYGPSDVVKSWFDNTENNKYYKTWVGHAVSGTNSYEWVEEANYKQMIMPIAIDYAKSEGWSFGKDWQSAKDLICNPGEPNNMISGETMNFLSSRNLAGDYTDYLTQIGAHEINSANKALAGSAFGGITPMELDSPFFGLGLGLKGFATGTQAITKSGIRNVEAHLATMDFDMGNVVMIHRLKRIESGHIKATIIDMNFYKHELMEKSFIAKGMSYDAAHVKTLEIQGIKYESGFTKYLYTEEADKASRGFDMWSEGIKGW